MTGKDGKNELDEFWNLDKLVPKQKNISPFATRNAVFDFSLPSADASSKKQDETSRQLTVSGSAGNASSFEYTPNNNGLIKKITVIQRCGKYDFYDNFRQAAKVNFDCRGEKCDFVQFYSYLPQYSQLTPSQKNYYFYWRSEVRRGKYPKSDYSYVYLFVYEIINLPDLVPPNTGLGLLMNIWREYRSTLPRIDLYFSMWVRDYCLLHRLEFPISEVSGFIFDIVSVSSFKEFYLSYYSDAGEAGFLSMLAYLSDYDYRRGKFKDGNPSADGERRARQAKLYRTHMYGALSELIKEAVVLFSPPSSGEMTATYRFDAFQNTVCTNSVKCSFDIEYYKLAEASELRGGVTAAVRYAENRLRAIMGVKSRLAVDGLPNSYKYILDGYFDALERRERNERERESAPAYERLYYAEREELSSDNADKIEALSWDTTARLTECSDGVEDAVEPPIESYLPTCETQEMSEARVEPTADSFGLDGACIQFIHELFLGNKCFGIEAASLAERVNEAFSDGFGDVILDFDGSTYAIIEDYREDVENWLKTHR